MKFQRKFSMKNTSQKERSAPRMAKNKSLFFIVGVFITLFLISMISAVSIGTFEKNTDIELHQTCNNCTYCNFTTIKYPNSTNILTNIEATKDGTYYSFNLSAGNITTNGEYSYTYDCGNAIESLTDTLFFDVNPTGVDLTGNGNIAIGILFGALLLAIIFIVLGFRLASNPKMAPISFVFIIMAIFLCLYSLHMAWSFSNDILMYESLGSTSGVIYTTILWLMLSVAIISFVFFFFSFIKELGRMGKIKSYGDGFNPITDTYDYH